MKKFLLSLLSYSLACLITVPFFPSKCLASIPAGIPKIAVLYDIDEGTSRLSAWTIAKRTLDRQAVPCDYFDISRRTWGAAGVADSTWFRQNYQAILIIYGSGGANGVPVANSDWSNNFLDASGNTGIAKSPLSGRWWLPVINCTPDGNTGSSGSYNDSTGACRAASGGNYGDCYVNGLTRTSPAGTIGVGTVANAGSWRYKAICRMYDIPDTIWFRTFYWGCRPASWQGAGSVACIIYADTMWGGTPGTNTCNSGDTLTVMWRWRPWDNMPGIYHIITSQGLDTDNWGILLGLQYIYSITNVRPRFGTAKIDLFLHNYAPNTINNLTSDITFNSVADKINSSRLPWHIATPSGATDFGSSYDGFALYRIKEAIALGRVRWTPFSNSWALNYYTAADTAGVNARWKSTMNTAARMDSLGLKAELLDMHRVVTGSGDVGIINLPMLYGQGVRIVESTNKSYNGTDAKILTTYHGDPVQYVVPGSTATMYVAGTFGWPDQGTFNSMILAIGASGSGGQPYWDEGLSLMLQYFTRVTYNHNSLYFHMNVMSNTDPYWAYFMDVLAKEQKYFNKVVEFNTSYYPQIYP